MFFRRGIGLIIRIAIAIVTVGLVCRFLGITWDMADDFIENGLKEALKFFSVFKGIASY